MAKAWVPQVTCDLASLANPKELAKLTTSFNLWSKSQPPLQPLNMPDGWYIITPEMAEQLLRRNPPGANRKLVADRIRYYGRMMVKKDWPRTGQPVIFDVQGTLLDAQHRLWACYLSGASFETYLVSSVPYNKHTFMYIDNAKARSATDALYTAGLNGLASIIASVIRMREAHEIGAFTPSTKHQIDQMSPPEIWRAAQGDPHLQQATHSMAGEFRTAADLMGHKNTACYVAYRILHLYGEDELDRFMRDLEDRDTDLPNNSPIRALQKALDDDVKVRISFGKKRPMKDFQVLGHVIKAFNAWKAGKSMTKCNLAVNEEYPQFIDLAAVKEAAE